MPTYKTAFHGYVKKDGSQRVYIRVIHLKRKYFHPLDIYLDKKQLSKRGLVINHIYDSDHNDAIHKERLKLEGLWYKFKCSTIEDLKRAVRGNLKTQSAYLLDHLDEFINDFPLQKGTLGSYTNLRHSIQKFNKSLMVQDCLKPGFYDDFIKYLFKSLRPNSVWTRVKTLKALLYRLRETKGYEIPQLKNWKKISEKTEKVFLNEQELSQLLALDMKGMGGLQIPYRWLLIACYTGLRISDLFRLSYHHIKGSTIRMRAKKNDNEVIIPIFKEISFIKNDIPKRISEQYFRRAIEKVLKKANIADHVENIYKRGSTKVFTRRPKYEVFRPHDCIRTYINLLLQRGFTIAEAALITGKTVRVISEHYAGADLQSILQKARDIG